MFQNCNLILFDLDGTISDPVTGVGRSINYALTSCGYEPIDLTEVAKYIGPPLDETFKQIIGHDADCQNLIAKYRDRYGDVGYSENVLYPGIAKVLHELNTANISMAICTSKRQDFAERILEMFGLINYFQFINGGEVGIHKYQQIESLLLQGRVSKFTVMIGDRAVDLIAAHKNGLTAGGVLWGYGSHVELLNETPQYLFHAPSELIQFARSSINLPQHKGATT
jgi:phosphoglycolate phosphatase